MAAVTGSSITVNSTRKNILDAPSPHLVKIESNVMPVEDVSNPVKERVKVNEDRVDPHAIRLGLGRGQRQRTVAGHVSDLAAAAGTSVLALQKAMTLIPGETTTTGATIMVIRTTIVYPRIMVPLGRTTVKRKPIVLGQDGIRTIGKKVTKMTWMMKSSVILQKVSSTTTTNWWSQRHLLVRLCPSYPPLVST